MYYYVAASGSWWAARRSAHARLLATCQASIATHKTLLSRLTQHGGSGSYCLAEAVCSSSSGSGGGGRSSNGGGGGGALPGLALRESSPNTRAI